MSGSSARRDAEKKKNKKMSRLPTSLKLLHHGVKGSVCNIWKSSEKKQRHEDTFYIAAPLCRARQLATVACALKLTPLSPFFYATSSHLIMQHRWAAGLLTLGFRRIMVALRWQLTKSKTILLSVYSYI